MKNDYGLSIIIPAYNCATCVGACLDSILHQQGADKFQIIVINDGSTDATASVVGEYCKKIPYLKLINQENSGVSVARNTGLSYATGDYVTFIDPDDQVGLKYSAYAPYFEKTKFDTRIDNLLISKSFLPAEIEQHTYSDKFFTNMLNAAYESKAEVVLGGKVTLNYVEKYIKRHIYPEQKVFGTSPENKTTILNQADCRETANFCLYSKKLLQKHNLRFVNGMQLDEDILFCMLACLYANKVATVPDVTYLYNRHTNSLSNAINREISNQKYTLANVQRFSKLLVELAKYPQYSSIYTHWLRVFSHECNKVPDSIYYDKFPPTRCAECPDTKCDKACFLHDCVLQRLQTNIKSLCR